MPTRQTANIPAHTEKQFDGISIKTVMSGDYSFEVQDPGIDAELRSRRIIDFHENHDPFAPRSQSVAASISSMAQRIREFDIAFDGPVPPRRRTV